MSYQPPRSSTNTMAVVSLVFGILSWILLPLIGAIVAVVCGHMARSEIRRTPPGVVVEGDVMAVIGLVLGYLQMLFGLALLCFFIMVFLGIGALSHWHLQ